MNAPIVNKECVIETLKFLARYQKGDPTSYLALKHIVWHKFNLNQDGIDALLEYLRAHRVINECKSIRPGHEDWHIWPTFLSERLLKQLTEQPQPKKNPVRNKAKDAPAFEWDYSLNNTLNLLRFIEQRPNCTTNDIVKVYPAIVRSGWRGLLQNYEKRGIVIFEKINRRCMRARLADGVTFAQIELNGYNRRVKHA